MVELTRRDWIIGCIATAAFCGGASKLDKVINKHFEEGLVERLNAEGVDHIEHGRYEEAINVLYLAARHADRIDPGLSAEPYSNLGTALCRLAQDLSTENTMLYDAPMGMLETSRKYYDMAIEGYSKNKAVEISAIEQGYMVAYAGIAQCYIIEGNLETNQGRSPSNAHQKALSALTQAVHHLKMIPFPEPSYIERIENIYLDLKNQMSNNFTDIKI